MKNLFLRKSVLGGLMLGALSLTACENFLDVNDNPNNPENVQYPLVLPNALNRPLATVGSPFNILGNLWTNNWGQASDFLFYLPQNQYNLTPATYDGSWQNMYSGAIADLRYVEVNAQEAKDKNYVAIAKIMEAYSFQILADGWGDVPFADVLAIDPRKPVTNLTPKYDAAETVYDGIITLLNDGLAQIDASAPRPSAQSDIYFGGDMAKWRRFANTLKLRVYMRQSRARDSKAKAGIQAMQQAGAQFLGASDNVAGNPGFSNAAGRLNPLYESIGFTLTGSNTSGYNATRANVFALNYLKETGDTLRMKALYAPRPIDNPDKAKTKNSNSYLGVVNGVGTYAPSVSQQTSPVGPAIIRSFEDQGYAAPVYLMTAAESFFLQAEAVERGYLTGTAKTLYQTGIEESFKLLGLTTAQASAYYNTSKTNPAPKTYYGIQPTAVLNAAAGQLDLKIVSPKYDDATTTEQRIEAIVTQKWIANNGYNGYESWSEFRRTGYPRGNYLSLSARQRSFPVRLPYPQTEANNNPNTPAGVTIFTPRLFWDVD